MRKPEIAKRLARQAGVSHAEAADQLDRVVHQILSKLRKSKPAPAPHSVRPPPTPRRQRFSSGPFPGLGRFTPGPNGSYRFKKEKLAGHGRK